MILLERTQRVLIWLCVCAPPEGTSQWKKLGYVLFSFGVFFSIVYSTFYVVVFFLEYIRIDLEESLYAFFQINAVCGVVYMMIAGIFLRYKVKDMLDNLTSLYKANKHLDLIGCFERANNHCEWMWRIYFLVASASFITTALASANCWLHIENLEENEIYHPYKVDVPWNTTTRIGYFGEIFSDLIAVQCYLIIAATFVLLFVSLCSFHQAFYRIFQHSIRQADQNGIDKELLCKLIRFHVSAKNFFLDSAEVFSQFLLVLLITSMLALSCCVFQMDMELRHPDLNMISLLNACICTLFNLFVYCYYGKVATDSYAQMADCLYECNWPDMPVRLQKFLIVVIINMQRPLCYHGFNVAVMNLETFTKLINSVVSYYMIFKTLTSIY